MQLNVFVCEESDVALRLQRSDPLGQCLRNGFVGIAEDNVDLPGARTLDDKTLIAEAALNGLGSPICPNLPFVTTWIIGRPI